MIVEEIMQTNLKTLTENDSVSSALLLMRHEKIRHIPLINEQNTLIGLITERDMKEVAPNSLFPEKNHEKLSLPLKKIIKTNVITAHPLDFIEDIAAVMYEKRIGCLPIVEQQKLVGLVTSTDILRTFVEITGANQPSSQIEIKVKNSTDVLHHIIGILRQHHIRIQSMFIYPDKTNAQNKIIVFRISTMNPVTIIAHLKKEGYDVLWPNMPRTLR